MSAVSDFAAFRTKRLVSEFAKMRVAEPQVEVFEIDRGLTDEQLNKVVAQVQSKLPKEAQQSVAIGSGVGVEYHEVDSAEYTVSSWIKGYHVYGVIYDGPVTIWLPKKLKKAIVSIKDERGNAASNNITVKAKQ